MKNLKGQAAMEYLMTYGWAILVVIAVVAALYGLGVFKIGSGAVKCGPCFSYFAFVDYSKETGTLVIKNGPRDITDITVYAPSGASVSPTTASTGQTITITGIPTSGDVQVTIGYTVTASGLSHNDTATIHN
jgi:hypothetical protein